MASSESIESISLPAVSEPRERPGIARSAPPSRAGVALRYDLLRGIGFILGSTVFLSCSDAISKYLSGPHPASAALPAIEIAWLRYVGFVMIVGVAVLANGRTNVLRSRVPGLQVLRGLATVASALLFIAGLHALPIAEATATGFVSPVFITVLSIPVLGERVGARRMAAAIVGLLGVLIVVRPGTSAFQPAVLLPILSATAWASAVVVTRKMSGTDGPLTTLAYSAAVGFVILTALLPFGWAPLGWHELLLGAFIGLASTAGHWLVILAYRHAEASVLAPFTYSQLVWSSGLGVLLFGALPDRWTFAGATVIAASGLYTAHRERVRARERAAQSA